MSDNVEADESDLPVGEEGMGFLNVATFEMELPINAARKSAGAFAECAFEDSCRRQPAYRLLQTHRPVTVMIR